MSRSALPLACRCLALLLLTMCSLATSAQTPLPQAQPNLDLLTNGEVYAMARRADGSLLIGGRFSQVADTPRANIARINADGNLDASFNPGADDAVHALLIDSSGNIYVGGSFFRIGGVARNRLAKLSSSGVVDATWNPNVSGTVHALALSTHGLYLGGDFTGVSGITQRRIARVPVGGSGALDSSFSPILNSGAVLAIAVDASNNVFIGGSFGDVQAVFTRARLAKLSSAGAVDASWLPQPNDAVRALLLQGSQLYVGGDFTQLGSDALWRIARVTTTGSGAADTGWNPNSVGSVRALAADSSGAIYAGGSFTQIGGQFRARLAKLNATGVGTAIADWNPGASGTVHALSVDFDGSAAAGGEFATAAGQAQWSLLRMNPAAGALPSPEVQLPGTVYDIGTQTSGGMIVGGNFLRAAGQDRRHLLRLDANNQIDPNWLPEPNAPVRVTTMSGSAVVYVGGEFTQIGGQTRNRIARLSTSGSGAPDAWNPAANGVVHAIHINASDNSIMVGGAFTQIGGQSRGGLAKLSNSGSGLANTVWNPGTNGTVHALAQRSSDLYVGGVFSTVGGQTRNNIARVSAIDSGALNTTWNPNANGPVFALLSSGEHIYAGGSFSNIGGQNHGSVARMPPGGAGLGDSFWGPFTLGGSVRSLVVANGLIYLGGDFGTLPSATPPAGPRGLTRLMTGSGTAPPAWTPTSNAPVYRVRSTSDGLLLLGGAFSSISEQPRKGLAALARLLEQAPLSITPNSNPILVGGTTSFTVTGGSGNGAGSIAVTAGASFCSIASGVLTGTAAGTCTVTATKAGDATYSPTTASTTVTVNQPSQIPQAPIALSANPTTIVFGATSILSITGGSGSGAVSYAVTAGASFCSISGSTLTGTGVGSCTVTATKAGDATYLPTTDTVNVTVNQAPQASLTLIADPSSITFGNTTTLSISGGSGAGAVSYSVTTGIGFCSVSGTTLTGIGVGVCTVTATKAGDANYLQASATRNVTVNKATQATLTVHASPSTISFGASSALSTSGGSGTGTVSYAVTLGASICSISGSTLTGIGVGTCTVTATKAGDANYVAASGTRDVAVAAALVDLQASITAPQTQLPPESPVIYTVVASNLGPAAAFGALLDVDPPATLIDVLWQCAQAQSTATCPPGPGSAGSGPLALVPVNLANGHSLTYEFSGVVQGEPNDTVTVTASIIAIPNMVDPQLGNNSATHSITLLSSDIIFRNGFEEPGVLGEP